MNSELNIICPECSNTPLLGIKFSYENKNIADICELYSYCIFEHNKENKKIDKINFENIILNKDKNEIKSDLGIKCEFCEEKVIEYHCLDCKRNICKECFENHKEHNFYYNKNYISEEELKQINFKFNESQKNIKTNLEIIYKAIREYESQLKELKTVYEKYKDINEKLYIFCNNIINNYSDLVKSKEGIYYPIYFNIKNILLFNPHQIDFPEKDISIKSFIDILNEKINSGFYFFITNSNLSNYLDEYYKYKENIINYDNINFKEFNEIEVKYEKILPFTNNKFIGIKNNKINNGEGLDIYNINNNNIESTINLSEPNDIFYKKEFNILIFISDKSLYIVNPKDYSIEQEISSDNKTNSEIQKNNKSTKSLWIRKRNTCNTDFNPGKFIFAEILSKESFVVIYKGDPRCLGEEYESILGAFTDRVINTDNDNFDEDSYGDYSYLIVYEKENDIFIPKKIILLIKNEINNNEVGFTSGKYVEIEEVEPYCSFKFKSLNQIGEKEFIISYTSKIELDRDQDYYYITDENYKDEIIYYYLNIKRNNMIKKIVCSTNKKSFLIKSKEEEIFYFLHNEEDDEEDFSDFMNEKNLKVMLIKTGHIYESKNVIIDKKTIIWWDEYGIYLGKIIKEQIEIFEKFNSNKKIIFVSFGEKCIFYLKK